MRTRDDKFFIDESKSASASSAGTSREYSQIINNRPETIQLHKMQAMANRHVDRSIPKVIDNRKAVIQRLTAAANAGHNNAPVSIARHNNAETITNVWGAASDTSNFTHANHSASLETIDVYHSNRNLGQVSTRGSDGHGIKKMHLVNSYLHDQSNNWGENWVWGSHSLNAAHTQLEEEGKNRHPNREGTVNFLNYESVRAGGRAVTGAQTNITTLINNAGQAESDELMAHYAPLDQGDLEIRVPGGNVDGNTFNANWATGVTGTTTNQIQVQHRETTDNISWGNLVDNTTAAAAGGWNLVFLPGHNFRQHLLNPIRAITFP